MKTFVNNRYWFIVLHLLFWIVSFNIFNAFFSRGVETGYVLDDFNLSVWNILFISNVIILVLLAPFIWLFKNIRKRTKWSVTSVILIIIIASITLGFGPSKDNLMVPLILLYFVDNFLYVLVFHITIIAAVYLNAKLLIPGYLSQGKFVTYLFAAVGLAIIAGCLNFALFDLLIDQIFPQFFYISWFRLWELILIMAGYLAVTTTVFLLWQYGRMLILNREKARFELSALKAQINPHFLFNNLNTIYAMAENGDQRTKEVILQLSDFLRYILYDTSSEKIDLEKEIGIIRTYVGLQKERVNRNITEVNFHVEGDFSGAQIAPLLLLPLAENCFKHGVGKSQGTIRIDVHYSNHQLHFLTRNRIERRENPLNHEEGGIGIVNVEKRLNLLYPGKHQLTIAEEGDMFNLELAIDLN